MSDISYLLVNKDHSKFSAGIIYQNSVLFNGSFVCKWNDFVNDAT